MDLFVNFIKHFIKLEFVKFSIPEGYHNISFSSEEIIIKSTSDKYNYSNHFSDDNLKFFPIVTKSILSNGILKFKFDLNNINKYKFDLFKEYPNIYICILSNDNINIEKIITELKSHLIKDEISSFYQELFDNLCTINEEYYCNLVNENHKNEIYPNYNNIELIKFILFISKVNLNYGLFNCLIKRINFDDLKYIIKYIKLDDSYENYLILKDIICSNCKNTSELIIYLLDNFIIFKDHGILSELIMNWNENSFNILECLTNDQRINKVDLIDLSIEFDNIDLYKYLIKIGYKVGMSHSDKLKKYKRFEFIRFKL